MKNERTYLEIKIRAEIQFRKKVFDEEGWYHTGDIGDETSGSIKIIGRKNGIYKTAQGE